MRCQYPRISLNSPMAPIRSVSSRTTCPRHEPNPDEIGLKATVTATEITGSESYVHLSFADARWTMLAHGIHIYTPDEEIGIFIDPRNLMIFDASGNSVTPPPEAGGIGAIMARIDLNHIRHAYGPNPKSDKDYALKEVHHSWEDGGAYALLGPSGCGKTSLLNIISGLIHPSHGQLLFDGQDVTNLSTQERNIAQVFQFPVIYDTMTVYDNLAFPLRNRGVAEAEIDRKVRETLDMIDLASWANKKARGLTADQKQKISLGRGLVRSDVNAILFDEPLTVIDPHMKWVLRSQLKQLHQRFGYTMVYVTHDQTEALTFAQKVVVMYDGEIVQIGTPEELFERPKAHISSATLSARPA